MVGVIGVNFRIFKALAQNGISVFMVSQASSENSTSIGVRNQDAALACEVLNEEFAFEAFLPRDKKERALVLNGLANETRTIIIYEAPHHLVKTLEELESVLGSDRKLTICRELTKRYEEKMQTTLSDSLRYYEQNEPRGEYVLVLQGKSFEEIAEEEKKNWESMTLEEHMQVYESQGIARKEAMKLVAKDRGISKRDVYQALLS